jgi:chemotaxis protein CheZ
MSQVASSQGSLNDRFGLLVAKLHTAVAANDEAAFYASFDQLGESLKSEFMPDLKRLTATAESALRRFAEDARIDKLASNEVPDARKRLAHVVQLTDEAAHRTLDLIEKSGPVVDQNAKDAAELLEAWAAYGSRECAGNSLWPERTLGFLERSLSDSERVRKLLSDMLMAQGYQDITGQIIRSVISLVGEIEQVLGQLAAIANGTATASDTRRMPTLRVSEAPQNWQQGLGPQVPGIVDATAVAGQDDIDALLASMAGQ